MHTACLCHPGLVPGKVVRNSKGKWGAGLSDPRSYGMLMSLTGDKAVVSRPGQQRACPVTQCSLQVVPLHPSKQMQPVQSAAMVGKEVLSMYGNEAGKRGTISNVCAGLENPFEVCFKSPLRGTSRPGRGASSGSGRRGRGSTGASSREEGSTG